MPRTHTGRFALPNQRRPPSFLREKPEIELVPGDAAKNIFANVDFFQALPTSSAIWDNFEGDLRSNKLLQRKLVRYLLHDITPVSAKFPDEHNLHIWSLGSVVGLAIVQTASASVKACRVCHGDARLERIYTYWRLLELPDEILFEVEAARGVQAGRY